MMWKKKQQQQQNYTHTHTEIRNVGKKVEEITAEREKIKAK